MDQDNSLLIELFGKDALNGYNERNLLIDLKKIKIDELNDLKEQVSHVFDTNLTLPDILVSAGAGVLMGLSNALMKTVPIKHDDLKDFGISKHDTRTAIDLKTPSVDGFGHDLHRQLGPTHDVFRFKETINLINADQTDFELWGSTINKIMGTGSPNSEMLRSMGMKLQDFIDIGGFKIPEDPGKELLHHLFVDFLTKRSLPIPGSTFIADHSKEMAKLMYSLYDEGFNLKNLLGNFSFLVLEFSIRSYSLFFKAIPKSNFNIKNVTLDSFIDLHKTYQNFKKSNNFLAMMMLGHGSSLLVDTLITTSSQNYVGLFQLNYGSLLSFSRYLLQYLIKCNRERKDLLKKMIEKREDIYSIDLSWQKSFSDSFIEIANSENFISFINPSQLDLSHYRFNSCIDNRKELNDKTNNLLKEIME